MKWAKECQDLGAGIILPTSMDSDGTLNGYDLEFTGAISDAVNLPVVASGGVEKPEDFYQRVIKGLREAHRYYYQFRYFIFVPALSGK